MTRNTSIVRWQPYTVIVTRDDEVFIYRKSWWEMMDFLMEHGFVPLKEYNTTLHKWDMRRSFEVNNKTHTSVENWIYSQPQEWCKRLLKEHRDRKWLNGYGIKSIEMWQQILDELMWKKPQKTAEQKEKETVRIDRKKAMRALKWAQRKLGKPSTDE